MKSKRLALLLAVFVFTFCSATILAQSTDSRSTKSEAPEPRAKDGKKLLTAMALVKISGVSAPRASSDLTRNLLHY